MKYHYVWLIWSSAFLVPWALLFALNHRYAASMPAFFPGYGANVHA